HRRGTVELHDGYRHPVFAAAGCDLLCAAPLHGSGPDDGCRQGLGAAAQPAPAQESPRAALSCTESAGRLGGGGSKVRWMLLAIMAIVTGASVVDAQPAPRPNEQPPAKVLQLPEITVRAPVRLLEPPLQLSEVPATVQVITGEELRQSGVVKLQEVLTRLPGVTLHDEQGNTAQPGISLRGFQGTSVTGVPQGISVFLDGVRLNEPTV